MTIKNTLLLILFSASLTAYADEAIPTTPQKADAEKWLTDFRAARDKTSDALFLNDANKRSQLTPVLKELRDRAENYLVMISASVLKPLKPLMAIG
jgi:hypothetical protein